MHVRPSLGCAPEDAVALWDAVLAVFWLACVGTAGKVLTDRDLWKVGASESITITCWKACFALSFILAYVPTPAPALPADPADRTE